MLDFLPDFLLPPPLLQDVELPEAFDRTRRDERTVKRCAHRAKATREGALLLIEYIEELKGERALSSAALRTYRIALESYLLWLEARGVTRLRDISAAHIEQYLHDLRSGQLACITASRRRAARRAKFPSAVTVAQRLTIVRGWHRFLARRYRWPDPTRNLHCESPKASSEVILSFEQIQNILAGPALSTLKGVRDRAILCLLCDGLSPAQIGSLRLGEEVNLQISPLTQGALQTYLEKVRPQFLARLRKKGLYSRQVFFTNRGTPLSIIAIHFIVKTHAATAQLPLWVTASLLQKTGMARRARGADLNDESGMEVAALPRAAQLRHAFSKAHPRA